MYQPKVNNTQQYSDSQGEHIVHKGKLVLIEDLKSEHKIGDLFYNNTVHEYLLSNGELDLIFVDDNQDRWKKMIPIIISETEKIEVGDKVTDGERIYTCSKVGEHRKGYTYSIWDENGKRWIEGTVFKILAFPKQFSDKHLQAIVDGKMKDEDEVLVKCSIEVKYKNKHEGKYEEWTKVSDFLATGLQGVDRRNLIHFDQQNHITLFPVQQSLEEAAKEYTDSAPTWDYNDQTRIHTYTENEMEKAFKVGAEWAKKNNY